MRAADWPWPVRAAMALATAVAGTVIGLATVFLGAAFGGWQGSATASVVTIVLAVAHRRWSSSRWFSIGVASAWVPAILFTLFAFLDRNTIQ
jgi:multisubunit Na+/H+ antiporter MnhB subunit